MKEIIPARLTRILVPLDGSPLAECALKPATDLAQANGAEVILLRVTFMKDLLVDMGGVYSYHLWEESVVHDREEAESYLEMVEKSRFPAGVAIRKLVLDGDEASNIVDAVRSEDVDLIVMSTHGRTGISRWLLGSVTEKVLRAAPCPVFVIPPPGRVARHIHFAPSQLPATEDLTVSRVLIPLDGSDLAEQCLDIGLGIACSLGAELLLLRVIEKPAGAEMLFATELEHWEKGLGEEYRLAHFHQAENYLGKVAGYARKVGSKVQTLVMEGQAAPKIIDIAIKEKIDLIVMTTHGRTGLRRWAYGSVTDKVLRGAHCAVTIVRPDAQHLN